MNTISANVDLQVFKQDKLIQESFPNAVQRARTCTEQIQVRTLRRRNHRPSHLSFVERLFIRAPNACAVIIQLCRVYVGIRFPILSNIRALEPVLISTAGQQLGKCLGRISRRRFLYRDLISQRNRHAIPQQSFQRPKTRKSTSFA